PAYGREYCWQVAAAKAGGTTMGPIWSFTTNVAPPAAPTVVAPLDKAAAVATNASFAWSATGATSYDINFGTTNPPPSVATGVTAATYAPSSLLTSTTYYW